MCLLEMISSDVQVPHAYKYLCKLINNGMKDLLIDMIEDKYLKEILKFTLNEKPDERGTVEHLKNHKFFQKSESDHQAI